MRALFFAPLFFFLLGGCSKFLDDFSRINTTQVNINTGRNANGLLSPFTCASPCLVGGMFVIAIDPNGNRFTASAPNEATTLSLTLASGVNYNFVAYGWDSTGMTGIPRCGYGTATSGGGVGSVPVNGATTDVYISMSQETCNDAMFAAAGLHFPSASYGPVPLTLSFCGHSANVGSGSYSSAPSSCSLYQSGYFTWGATGTSMGNGGYLSAASSVVISIKGAAIPTLLTYNVSSGTQSTVLTFTASNRLNGVQVAPALNGSGGTQRFAFMANLNNPEIDDLYLCTPGTCSNAASYVTHFTHDASACTGTANVTIATAPISFSGCTATPGQLIIDPTGTIPPDTFVGTGGTTMVNEAGTTVNATASNSSLPVTLTTAPSVREFRFSPDGRYLVYVVLTPGTTPRYNLYSVDITGASPGAPRLLNGSLTGAMNGVGLCLGNATNCNNQDQRFIFQVSPVPAGYTHLSQPYVIYASDETTAGVYDMRFATLDGSNLYTAGAPQGTITTNLSTAGDYTNGYTFTNDGAYVLAHTSASGVDRLYGVAVTGTAAPAAAVICGSSPSGLPTCNVSPPNFFAVANSPTAANALAAFQTYTPGSPNLPALNVINLAVAISSGTNPLLGVLKPGTATTSEASFREFQFTPDDNYLVALSQDTSNNATCVRSAPKDASATTISYNSCPGQVAPNKVNGGNYVRVVKDTSSHYWVLFLNLRSGTDYDLVGDQIVPSAPAALTTLSLPSLTTGKGVHAYGFGSDGNAYYSTNPNGGTYELYRSTLSTSPTRTQLGSAPVMGSISAISDDSQPNGQGGNNDLLNTGYFYLEAAPLLGGGSTEAFVFQESAASFQRVTALNGLGRVQISIDGANGAGTSQCLVPSAPVSGSLPVGNYLSNGVVTPGAVKIPFGDGTSASPFATTISVYANATSCNGAPTVQYHYPHGLAGLVSPPDGTAKLYTSSGPNNALLYLTDQ